MSELVPRAVCYRCFKPELLCLCARVPRVANRTGVLVLQHPRERLHPIGTARLAQLGLERVRIEVAWNAGEHEDRLPAWIPEGTALLYPAVHATELTRLAPQERPRHLLVLDGTWHTARALRRDKTWLQRLPAVRLTPAAPSRYRLRLEPFADYVSTIEAIVGALRVLEPQTSGFDALLGAFESMIDDQLAYVLRRAGTRVKRPRRPAAERRLPEALVSGFARMIVVYVESARGDAEGARKLAQVSALALASGELRQWHTLPRAQAPAANVLSHMQLAAADFDAAVDLRRFCVEWRDFLAAAVGPQPIIAAWNQSTLELLRAAGADLPAELSLKSAYRGRVDARHANLDQVIAAEALDPAPNSARGRAAWRLGCASAVAHRLHALADQGTGV